MTFLRPFPAFRHRCSPAPLGASVRPGAPPTPPRCSIRAPRRRRRSRSASPLAAAPGLSCKRRRGCASPSRPPPRRWATSRCGKRFVNADACVPDPAAFARRGVITCMRGAPVSALLLLLLLLLLFFSFCSPFPSSWCLESAVRVLLHPTTSGGHHPRDGRRQLEQRQRQLLRRVHGFRLLDGRDGRGDPSQHYRRWVLWVFYPARLKIEAFWGAPPGRSSKTSAFHASCPGDLDWYFGRAEGPI